MILRSILILSTCFCLAIAKAQDGLFLKPSAGIGLTNIREKNFLVYSNGQPAISYNAELALGYQLNNIRFSIGAGLLTTGQVKKRDSLVFEDYFNSSAKVVERDVVITHTHAHIWSR